MRSWRVADLDYYDRESVTDAQGCAHARGYMYVYSWELIKKFANHVFNMYFIFFYFKRLVFRSNERRYK